MAEKPIDPDGMAPDEYVSPDANVLEHSIQHYHLLKEEKAKSSTATIAVIISAADTHR